MEIRCPRIEHICFSDRPSRSLPSNITLPESIVAGGVGTSRIIESAVTLFPHPDSPTIPNVRLSPSSKETPRTAWAALLRMAKETRRSLQDKQAML
jgi:hypothetical protein